MASNDEPLRDAQIAALRRERAAYLAQGKQDRAAQVAALLADLGAPVKGADKPRPRGRHRMTSG